MDLKDRLREVREGRALSQHGLSEISGVHFNTISGIESGKRKARPSTVRKLAGALGVPVEELTGGPRQEVLMPPSMAEFLRSLDLEPEEFFVDVEISSDAVRKLYDAAYTRLLQAEKKGSIVPFLIFEDEDPDRNPTLELVRAVKELPEGDEKARIRERARAMAEREAALFVRAAEEAERRERELLEAGQEMVGAA